MMDSNVSKKEILILVLIILIFLGFLFYFKFPIPITTYLPLTKQSNLIPLKQISYESALDSNNLSSCKNILDEKERSLCEVNFKTCLDDSCYFEKAQHFKDELYCFKIVDKSLKQSCSSTLNYAKLIQDPVIKDDITLCNNFVDPKNIKVCQDNFYFVNSVNKADKSLCLSISNEVFKNECLQ